MFKVGASHPIPHLTDNIIMKKGGQYESKYDKMVKPLLLICTQSTGSFRKKKKKKSLFFAQVQ